MEKLKQEGQLKQAQMQMDGQFKAQDAQQKAQAEAQKAQMDAAKLDNELRLAKYKVDGELQIAMAKANADIALKREELGLKAQHQQAEIGLKRDTEVLRFTNDVNAQRAKEGKDAVKPTNVTLPTVDFKAQEPPVVNVTVEDKPKTITLKRDDMGKLVGADVSVH